MESYLEEIDYKEFKLNNFPTDLQVLAKRLSSKSISVSLSIFFNSILSGWERWKLFCKLWSVLGLVRLANVLTPVRWLIVFFDVVISSIE